MRDEMKRTMFELFGVGSEDDKVLAAGGKKPAVKPEPVKTAPVQAPVQPVVKAKAASYLAAGTSLEGTLRSDGDVEIAGAFKGEVITTGTVTLRSVIQSNITDRKSRCLAHAVSLSIQIIKGTGRCHAERNRTFCRYDIYQPSKD